jgi:hypothetical protein
MMSAAALARWNRHADNSSTSTSTSTDTISREDTHMMGGRGGENRINPCFSFSGVSSAISASDDMEGTRRL